MTYDPENKAHQIKSKPDILRERERERERERKREIKHRKSGKINIFFHIKRTIIDSLSHLYFISFIRSIPFNVLK